MESDQSPDLENVLSSSPYYELNKDEANKIYLEIQSVVNNWEKTARTLKISKADIELMRPAFISN